MQALYRRGETEGVVARPFVFHACSQLGDSRAIWDEFRTSERAQNSRQHLSCVLPKPKVASSSLVVRFGLFPAIERSNFVTMGYELAGNFRGNSGRLPRAYLRSAY
jgi:hypothetical protein